MEGITVGNSSIYTTPSQFQIVTVTKNRFPLLCNAAASVALQTIKKVMPVRHIIVGDNCQQLETYGASLQSSYPDTFVYNVTPDQLDMNYHSLPSRLSALRYSTSLSITYSS